MDKLLAKPPSSCCFRPAPHQLQTSSPKGSIRKIGGVDTYISIPPTRDGENGSGSNKFLLYFPDAFGLYENAFLMMDSFAEEGWVVLGVDYFDGVSVSFFFSLFSFWFFFSEMQKRK